MLSCWFSLLSIFVDAEPKAISTDFGHTAIKGEEKKSEVRTQVIAKIWEHTDVATVKGSYLNASFRFKSECT